MTITKLEDCLIRTVAAGARTGELMRAGDAPGKVPSGTGPPGAANGDGKETVGSRRMETGVLRGSGCETGTEDLRCFLGVSLIVMVIT